MLKKILLVNCLFYLAGCVNNQPPTTSIVPETRPSVSEKRSALGYALMDLENKQADKDFTVKLLTRRGGESLRVGDVFDIDMTSSKTAFLSLYIFQTGGEVFALTENLYVRAGEKVAFPPLGSTFQLKAYPPIGNNALLLLATTRPIAGTIYHDNRYLKTPHQIVSTQLGAIGVIKSQLHDMKANEWQSTVLDVPVYR